VIASIPSTQVQRPKVSRPGNLLPEGPGQFRISRTRGKNYEFIGETEQESVGCMGTGLGWIAFRFGGVGAAGQQRSEAE
jgi:hypothetical protein